jgi:endoglycosylceramidase
LEPLWNKCNDKIRLLDNSTLVFFEGVTWDIRDGHGDVPGGDGTKTAISYHYYSPPQLALHSMFWNRRADQRRLGTGGILTEFDMRAGNEEHMKEMRDTLTLADTYLQSWMGWAYNEGLGMNPNPEIEGHYARTYAPAVAGLVLYMKFDKDSSEFEIQWIVDASIEAPTEFKLNRGKYYPQGFLIDVAPSKAATWEAVDSQNIILKYTPEAVDGAEITVTIRQNVSVVTTTTWSWVSPSASTTDTTPPTNTPSKASLTFMPNIHLFFGLPFLFILYFRVC